MNLTENSSYLSLPKNKLLVEKVWKEQLAAYNQVAPLNLEKKTAIAVCLENTKQALNHALRESNATQSYDLGAYKRYALDIA